MKTNLVMKRKSFTECLGGLLSIWPRSRYEMFVPRQSVEDRLGWYFHRVGNALVHSMEKIDSGQEAK